MSSLIRITSRLTTRSLRRGSTAINPITYGKINTSAVRMCQRSLSSNFGSSCPVIYQEQKSTNVCQVQPKRYIQKYTTFNEHQKKKLDANAIAALQTRVLNVCSKYDKIDSTKVRHKSS